MKIINLLPKNRQQELRYEALLGRLYFVVIISAFSFALVFLSQFGARVFLEKQLTQLAISTEQIKKQIDKQDNAQVREKIKQINDQVSDYKDLVDNSPKWSKLLKAFAKLPPKGVRIIGISTDETQKTIVVNGFSPTRELILDFYDRINADKENFFGLDKYLENIAKPTDVSFHLNFQFKPELIK